MAAAKISTNHDEIRRWAEERGGRPSCVRRTGNENDPGILRINFPGFSGETSLNEISWEEWFEKFDGQKLALLHQDETRSGEKSNFNKIVSREGRSSPRGKSRGSSRPAGSSRSKGAASRSKASAGGGRSSGTTKENAARKRPAAKTGSSRGGSSRRSGAQAAK